MNEHAPEDCAGCGAPTNDAEGGLCPACRADSQSHLYVE